MKPKIHNIFELAKKENKVLVFVFFEDKVFLFLGNKKPNGVMTFEILRKDKKENYEIEITPDQEFTLHTPKISYKHRDKTIEDYIVNFDRIEFLVDNPKDVEFTLSPYDVPAIFIIYPHEILSRDILKNLSLIEVGEGEIYSNVFKLPLEKETMKTLKVKVFSPAPYALDKYSVKTLSAKSRISLIDTLLQMLKEIQLKVEGLYKTEETKPRHIFSFLFEKEGFIKFMIIMSLILIAIAGVIVIPKILQGLASFQMALPPPPTQTIQPPPATFP